MKANPEVEAYLEKVADHQKEAVQKLVSIARKSLPKGFEECINYGMIGYVVPHTLYPKGYHCDPKLPLPFLSIAAQKAHIGFYHMGVYAQPELMSWFQESWKNKVSYKLDMGKSCIRFKKPDQIPFELMEELCTKLTVDAWIKLYESAFKK